MWKKAEEKLLKDKYVGPLIKEWGHCAIKPRIHTDYFQGLVGEIIGQQLSGKVAGVIYKRLKLKIRGILTVNKILFLPDDELRNCGMAWSKVRAIKDLALKIKDKKLHIRKLNELSDEIVEKELTNVKGIGPWTAQMFLMFTLGRADIFPTNDLGIKKGFEKVTGKKWDKIKSVKFAEKYWKPYRTVASWYLWRSLEKI
ncbi:MAG: DNA-3-methyladenine glycosylase 2 family protein [Candidatus Woesebacteria bacterium]|nr:DNA-3-methyladenine glycosylase 2 family protein [Candidatus Woesebacteria bacterium]